MYFLLDKDYAINNIARCIGVSSKPFTDDEIKLAKKIYGSKETIIFIGDDIPHHIEFNSTLNTIVEKIPAEEEIETLSAQDEVVEELKVFNEDVEVEAGVFYFYIDKNIADTEYRTETIATFTKPLLNPNEYLQKEVYEVKGTDIPFYVTVEDGEVRESTKYEQYLRGQYKLQEREVAFKEEVIYLEEGWYIESNELIKVERPDDMVKPVFNEKTHIWEEKATELEKAQSAYRNYMGLNDPNSVRKMTSQSVIDDYWSYIDELEIYIELTASGIQPISADAPKPSNQLKTFFENKFKI